MIYDEAEEFWREQLNAYDDNDGIDATFKEMVEVALEAFEARKGFEDECNELRKEILELKANKSPIASLVNYIREYDMNNATTSFNVDNCKVTITVERKGE